MGRSARVFSESGIYHIMFRGSNKQAIFVDKWDYEKFLTLLAKVKEKKRFEIHAYCLMTNHVHMVIKEKENRDVSDIMKRLLCEYVVWFNLKYNRTGMLMENRYKSRAVEDDNYYMHVVRYIHQNPVKAGIVQNITDYPWSSYTSYIKNSDSLVDIGSFYEVMPKAQFVEFHNEEEKDNFDLAGKRMLGDDDLITALKKLGIDDVKTMKYMPPEQLKKIISELKKRFSARHIQRVTGIDRRHI